MRAFLRAKTVVLSFSTLAMVLACTVDTAKEDTTNTIVTVTNLQGIAASQTGTATDDLFSDVCDNTGTGFPTQCIAVNDFGSVTMRADPKNLVPSLGVATLNNVIFDRYRVTYVRADGRNTAGVDVPYPFDGVMNFFVEISQGEFTTIFTIVRQQAKLEPPLRNLQGAGGAVLISTLAQVDFFGKDRAGRTITVRGYLNINFGDF